MNPAPPLTRIRTRISGGSCTSRKRFSSGERFSSGAALGIAGWIGGFSAGESQFVSVAEGDVLFFVHELAAGVELNQLVGLAFGGAADEDDGHGLTWRWGNIAGDDGSDAITRSEGARAGAGDAACDEIFGWRSGRELRRRGGSLLLACHQDEAEQTDRNRRSDHAKDTIHLSEEYNISSRNR